MTCLLQTARVAYQDRDVAGFPEHEVEVNAAKTRLSFNVVVGGVVLQRNEYVTPDGSRFVKWCGLLINAATINVQVGLRHGFPFLFDHRQKLERSILGLRSDLDVMRRIHAV